MADRRSRVYLPPLRVDVTIRDGVPRIVSVARLARAIRSAAVVAGAPEPSAVGLLLTDDAELAALNRQHMGHRGPTDVLSFPLLPPVAFGRTVAGGETLPPGHGDRSIWTKTMGSQRGGTARPAFVLPPGVRVALGDIAVSVERAIAQAPNGQGDHDSRTSWDARDELLLLVIHGALHLCGWDHADPAEGDAMRALERQLLGKIG